jgi:hypothetical protein
MPRQVLGAQQAVSAKLMRWRFTPVAIALLAALSPATASAESVPFNCAILPSEDVASVTLKNSLSSDASCVVTCKFSTTKYNDSPQITCAKPVPAGKEVEMCRLPSGGDKMVKLMEGHAECTK